MAYAFVSLPEGRVHCPMRETVEKVAVLGAGTMGSRIAAHLANAGIRSVLLDMAPCTCSSAGKTSSASGSSGAARSLAAAGLENARRAKPAAFFETSLTRLVTVGNFDDNPALDRKWRNQTELDVYVVAVDLHRLERS